MNTKYTIASLVLVALLVGGAMLYNQSDTTEKVALTKDTISKNSMLATVSASTFASKNTTEERTIIDVRTPEEYEAGHIKGSQNIDLSSSTFTQDISALDTTKQYSVYCRSGNRSGQALQIMKSLGFEDVIDLGGGIVAWGQAGETLCTGDC